MNPFEIIFFNYGLRKQKKQEKKKIMNKALKESLKNLLNNIDIEIKANEKEPNYGTIYIGEKGERQLEMEHLKKKIDKELKKIRKENSHGSGFNIKKR